MIIYNQKGKKNLPDAYAEAEKKGLLNKKWFVIDSFSEELIGAYDSFDEAWEANQIK